MNGELASGVDGLLRLLGLVERGRHVSVVATDRVRVIEHAGLAVESASDAGFELGVVRKRAGRKEGRLGKFGRRESLRLVEENSDDDEREDDDQTAGDKSNDGFHVVSDNSRHFLGFGGAREDAWCDGLAGRGEILLIPGVGRLDADLVLGVFAESGDRSGGTGSDGFRFDEVDVS